MGLLQPIDPIAPSAESFHDAVRILRAGGLVAFPTETVYGLGARLFDAAALGRVFAAKGRPAGHPLIAHVLDIAQARTLSLDFGARAESLARAFWPGPLTLVVPRAAVVPDAATGGGPTVAIRAPAHPVARGLIEALGEPIAAPSANRYQTVSPTRAEHVARSLGAAVQLILDGGPCAAGIESTVLDLSSATPRVLRPGAIALDALRAHLPELAIFDGGPIDEQATRASPGMDARHYAPRASLMVVDGRGAAFARRQEIIEAGEPLVALLLVGGPAVVDLDTTEPTLIVALPDEAEGYARGLYAALHALDAAGARVIVVEQPPDGDRWLAIRDRLHRASH